MKSDVVVPFVLESLPIRGGIVQLQHSWQRMLLGHTYKSPTLQILGHAAAASALIAQSLKFDGSITLQLSGKGPLSLLVMQCTKNLELRGMASADDVHDDWNFSDLVVDARCAITVDGGAMEQPYQGIVEVSGESLAESLQSYFAKSVQIPSRLQLVCDESVCGGMLLQHMPDKSSPLDDDWRRFGLLAATLGTADLAGGVDATLLGKLFAEDDIRVFKPRPVAFRCRCSERRAEEVLRLLGEEETRAACSEQGGVTVTCEYCGKQQRFDAVDISRIFAGQSLDGSDAVH